MKRLYAYYRALLSAELAATAAYRAQIVVSLIGWVVPFAMIALWRGAAGAEGVEGISAETFTAYFLGVLVTTSLGVLGAVLWGFGELVESGRLASLLLRPFHPIHALVAHSAAESVVRVVPLLSIASLAAVVVPSSFATNPRPWLLALLVFAIGLACDVYIAALVGMLAVWMTKSVALQGLLLGAEWLLGGLVTPVALLPGALATVARSQPLWFAVGAPSELISGMASERAGVRTLLLAVVWLLALHVTYRQVWRRSMLRYESVGT